MSPGLSANTSQALERLRAYRPPPTIYNSLPLCRRSAVLILLYQDLDGDLRVVLTLRASTLRTHAGQVSCPGGKADSLQETPFDTARREAFEEIGLPVNDSGLPNGFRVEHLTELDLNLAKVHLAVRPCVAFIHSPFFGTERSLIPRLDSKEVAAVFTEKLENFLLPRRLQDDDKISSAFDWHTEELMNWNGSSWIMHSFYSPEPPATTTPVNKSSPGETLAIGTTQERGFFKIFGLTARLMMDCAKCAFDRDPEFRNLKYLGDEAMIRELAQAGHMGELSIEEEHEKPKI